MRESKRRIREYQKKIPILQAKLVSAALFFMISILMMTSASLAWITLSRSPEVKGIETTLVGNGNLEIALSNEKGTEPGESMVGDSQLPIIEKNETWGNLVNLSDTAYGLEQIILRPASLNLSALSTSPLFAAEYAEDGRINDLSSDFAYSNYDAETEMFRVPASPEYGVRAVSSVTYTFVGGQQIFVERLNAAKSRITRAQSIYTELCSNKENMAAIGGIMGDFLTDRFNGSTTNMAAYVPYIYDMMLDFDDCMEMTGEAILYVANLQILMKHGSAVEPYKDIDELISDSKNWSTKGVVIEGLSTYISDRSTFAKHLATMAEINTSVVENGATVYWTELQNIFNFLVDINSTEVDGLAVKDIGKDEAASLVFKSDHVGVIKKGALFNMEERLGAYMYVENLQVKAKYMISITLEADVTTQAAVTRPNYIPNAIASIEKNNSGSFAGTDPVAAETYGMAVDFWVRSNAENDYLLLEGKTITSQIQRTDEQGNYYFTNEVGEVVLGRKTSNDEMEYHLEDGTPYELAEGETLLITYDEVVIGYEGINRIWDEEALSQNSATQGSGSCYVFYADTPQQQAQSLELLKAMTVVFIDDAGKLLAYADMDTESHFAEVGRVTVPLKLRTTSLNLGTDSTGKTIYAVTELEKNKSKRITALIYVDGSKISNSEVLADADIQGQLNLQFGSYMTMEALKDEKVYHEEIHLSAKADKTNFDGQSGEAYTTNVELSVSGLKPDKVTAHFIRQINETQGTRLSGMNFHQTGEGTYSGSITFKSPGTYILRSAILDGVEYDLDEPVTVTISGFAINSVSWQYASNYQKVMSAESDHTERIDATFGGMNPTTVHGIFSNADNQQITIPFKRGTTSWTGSAKFATSGVYSLKYMMIDGEYYEIPESMQKTLDLSLGMNARVAVSETSWTYTEPKTVNVYVTVADNKGTPLKELEKVSIQYMSQSSSLIENGLQSALVWNDEAQRYEGRFNVQYAGAYDFGYLSLSGSTINSATAPVITAIPPVPPSYGENLTDETIFAFGTDVSMKLTFNASTAIAKGNMTAVFHKLDENGNPCVDAEGNIIEILSKDNSIVNREDLGENITERAFAIPTTDELRKAGYSIDQLGTWKMQEIRIVGAYYNGKVSTEEEPMIIDVSGENIITTIDDEMTVVVSGNNQTITSLFSNKGNIVDGLEVEIRGAGGDHVANAETVTVTYSLDFDNSNIYASTNADGQGYDAASKELLRSFKDIKVKLLNDSDSNKFIIDYDNPLVLPFAGQYEFASVSFDIGSKTYTATRDGNSDIKFSEASVYPAFEMKWETPVVEITEITKKDQTINVNTDTSEGCDHKVKKGTAKNTLTDSYTCTVHIEANNMKESNGCDDGSADYTLPKVTTELSNIGSFATATLHVKKGSREVVYTYSPNSKEVSQDIGSIQSGRRYILGSGAKGTHLDVIANLELGTITYSFALGNGTITINNPY